MNRLGKVQPLQDRIAHRRDFQLSGAGRNKQTDPIQAASSVPGKYIPSPRTGVQAYFLA